MEKHRKTLEVVKLIFQINCLKLVKNILLLELKLKKFLNLIRSLIKLGLRAILSWIMAVTQEIAIELLNFLDYLYSISLEDAKSRWISIHFVI